MAVAVALAFTSCDTKKASASDKSESASTSERVEESAEEKVEEPKAPTGDAAADAKQVVEEGIALMTKDIKSEADVENMDKARVELEKKYEDFYKEKGEDQLKKFIEEVEKLWNDPEITKKIEESDMAKVMMEKAQKFIGESGK